LFRNCAATSIAVEQPEHVHIIKSVLGHTNLRTGERYYNHAGSLEAFRTLQTHVLERRRQARSRHDGPNVNGLGED
jgi:integrase/recombinase XerD